MVWSDVIYTVNVESLGSLSLSPHETKISADTTRAKREKIFLIDLFEL